MDNTKSNLPPNFLLEITKLPGSGEDVCLKAISHYKKFLKHPEPVIKQIAEAMVGNLTEYYNISHRGSPQCDSFLPHLSETANFMDSKNSVNMDIESTARIKAFYSTYEKLLLECSNKLEKEKPIPASGLAKDIVATRDVFHPRYQFKNNPQAFYKHVYKSILEFMEHIDDLHDKNPLYSLEEVSEEKHKEIERPKRILLEKGEEFSIPVRDFTSYALELKGVPEIYRYLIPIAKDMDRNDLFNGLLELQRNGNHDEIDQLPIAKLLLNKQKVEDLKEFRDELEQEFIDSISSDNKIYDDYKTKSRENFLRINKLSIKPEYRDYLTIIASIDEFLQGNTIHVNLNDLIDDNNIKGVLDEKLEIFKINQHLTFRDKIQQLKELDLSKFDEHLKNAEKIERYARCSKDYMKFPKERGYQSFHVTVKTPFGYYEKQFRTAAQHQHAEYGSASHSKNYKPYEKESFHRLKVPTPLMPKKDSSGDIITPLQLLPISFEEAVREYYHKDFAYFADGLSMEMFEFVHQDDFDEAMLNLSQSSGKMIVRINKAFGFLKNFVKIIQPKSADDYDSFNR